MSAATPSPSSLVGRERERGALRERLAAALAGRGGLVLIGGEAGIGKTALAEELCDAATGRGARVLIGRCYDLAETPPYGPWVELFGKYRPDDTSPALPAAFARPGVLGAVGSQAALFRDVRDCLIALAAHRPLLLFLDDVHWSDPASLDLLRLLARDLATVPLLIVVAYRTEEVTRDHPLTTLVPLLVREASAVRLDVQPLGAEDVRAMLADRYILAPEDAARLVAYLQERAEGNALFLGELLRTLGEEGIVRETGSGWAVGDLARAPVPRLLRQVIDGRLLRLGEDAGDLLAIGAVIGQEVAFALWAAVAERDEATLLAAVERAAAAHLMEETPDGVGARFVHALIREAVYEGIRPSRRRALHRRVGEILAVMPTADPDAIAYHLRQAGDDRAAEWLVKAGERAQRASAWLTAADRYEAAVALMETTDAPAVTRGWVLYRLASLRRFIDPHASIAFLDKAAELVAEADDRLLAAHVLFSRGLVQCMAIRDPQQGIALMEAGATAMDALSAADYVGRNPIDTIDSGASRGTLITWNAYICRFAAARTMAERYLTQPLPPSATKIERYSYASAYNGLAIALAFLGRPEEARDAFARSRALWRTIDAHIQIGMGLTFEIRHVLVPYYADSVTERQRVAADAEEAWTKGWIERASFPPELTRLALMVVDGQWSEALLATSARSLVIGGGSPVTVATIAYGQGDPERAWSAIGMGAQEFKGVVGHNYIGHPRIAVALALDAGDLSTAREWLDAHDHWLTYSGAVLGRSEGHALWARYHRVTGNADLAYDRATQALAHASDPRQPLALLAAHRLLGELDTAMRHFDSAIAHLDAALALADACAAPYERALTLLAYAELRAAMNDGTQAMVTLDEVRALCIPLDARPALARADALAARLHSAKDAAPGYPAGLSAREVEVLRLIAAGQTNRAIADALFIAEKTVERHITHILTKANVPNRAAAAIFATHHGLM